MKTRPSKKDQDIEQALEEFRKALKLNPPDFVKTEKKHTENIKMLVDVYKAYDKASINTFSSSKDLFWTKIIDAHQSSVEHAERNRQEAIYNYQQAIKQVF